MRTLIWSLLLSCSLAFSLEASEVYKWVDEDGVVHFTDRPPQDQPYDQVDVEDFYSKGEAPPGGSVYEATVQQQKIRREARIEEQERQARERKEEAERKAQSDENCSRAIHYLNTLQLQCPVFYDGAGILRAQCRGYYLAYEGERTYIDDKERAELIDHYRRVVEQCKEKYR